MSPQDTAEEPLRVLVLSQSFWPEEFRINSFIDELRRAGADIAVLTGQPNYPAGKIYDNYRWSGIGVQKHPSGYDVFRVPLIPRGPSGALRLVLNYLSFLVTATILGPFLLRGRKFDVIFIYATSPVIQGFAALPLRRLKRAPVVLWVQDLWPTVLSATGYVHNRHILSAVQRVVAWLYRSVDLVLAQSDAFVEAIRPFAGRTPVECFPNPGDPAPTGQVEAPVRLPDAFNVVFAGNIGRLQAVESIVDAATLLRDEPGIRITLFGSGSMLAWIEQQVEERKLTNLVLAGRVPPEAMRAIFAQASALLLTIGKDEFLSKTVPSKLQSYLGTGIPVIAATMGEAARVVRESGGGITCPPEDPAALAGAIRALRALSPDKVETMRRSGLAYYDEEFEPSRLATRLIRRLQAAAAAYAAPRVARR